MIALSRALDARGLTQAAAVRLLGVTQPRISDLERVRIERFSIDTLVTLLAQVGIRVAFSTRWIGRVS